MIDTTKLDRKAITAEIKKREDTRRHIVLAGKEAASGLANPDSQDRKATEAYWSAFWKFSADHSDEAMTRLYALRAHCRGRLHMKKRWITWDKIQDPAIRAQALATSGRACIAQTMQDQEQFIGTLWTQFQRPQVETQAA